MERGGKSDRGNFKSVSRHIDRGGSQRNLIGPDRAMGKGRTRAFRQGRQASKKTADFFRDGSDLRGRASS